MPWTVWIPIVAKDKMRGMIVLGEKESKEMFTQEDITLLYSLANQTSLVIENINLYEEVLWMKNYNDDILKNMTGPVMTVDMSGNVVTFNDAAEKFFSIGREQTESKNYAAVLSDRNLITAVENCLEGNEIDGVEFEVLLKSGEKRAVTVSAVVLRNQKKRNNGALIVINDITHFKQLEEAVRQKEKLASLGTMAAGMAHEIKNPLSSIKVLSQLMAQKYQDPEFRKKFLKIMPVEVNRIDRIVEGMLGHVRANRLRLEEADINGLIKETADFLEPQIKTNSIHLALVFQDIPKAMVDAMQLSQVFVNIMQNAIQAMENGGTLAVSTKKVQSEKKKEEFIEIKISDTGIGMSKENLTKIFDPFFTMKYGGTGLGLTIVHGIVVSHGGTIEVKSKEKAGTVFQIQIPVKGPTFDTHTPSSL